MKRSDEVLRLVYQWIESGTLAAGTKAPSVRKMSRITGYSMSTVHNAYGMLESAGVFVAHPRSGFFVDHITPKALSNRAQDAAAVFASAHQISISELTLRLFASWGSSEIQQFGAIYPSDDLFPIAEINRHFRRVLRAQPRDEFESLASTAQGSPALREALTRRYIDYGVALKPDDLVLTAGGMHGLNLCINVLTKPGDIVLVEAPSMFPIFAALEHRGLRAVEIPYHPRDGLDPDQFDYLTRRHDIRACVLMPVHQYPTGVTTPESAVRRIVDIARKKELPIIENGGYMDLYYDGGAPATLKKFDEAGLVLQIGSFSNSLAPGYGVGWLAPGRFRERIIQMKFAGNLISGGIFQRAIADYMQSSGFDRHLRGLRGKLRGRMARGQQLITENFPAGCTVTTPVGGFMCWVETASFNSVTACREALARGVGLPPGPLFSVRESFPNYLGLNFSFPWTAYSEARLKMIGELIARFT